MADIQAPRDESLGTLAQGLTRRDAPITAETRLVHDRPLPAPADSSGGMFHGANGFTANGAQFINVGGGWHLHQNLHAPTGAPAVLTPQAPLQDTEDSYSENEIYCTQLLGKRRGFPLHVPKPQPNLPPEYLINGVAIGDVGMVTEDGIWDFFFNIFLPADDPINSGRVPDTFSPLEPLVDGDYITHDFEPGTCVASPTVQKYGAGFQLFPGGQYTFSCRRPKGALLALPYGSHVVKLNTKRDKVREYAVKNAESWYRYINGSMGRRMLNGDLYLITGHEKALEGGIATFQNIPAASDFNLEFRPFPHPSSRYHFNETPAQTKTFVPPLHDGTHLLNNTIFLHGFTMSLGEGLWGNLFGTVGIDEIASIPSPRPNTAYVPFGSGRSGISFLFDFLAGGLGEGRNKKYSDGKGEKVLIKDISPSPKVFHPSRIINAIILEKVHDAKVVIIHDDDWADVLCDNVVQNTVHTDLREKLFQRLEVTENGTAYLKPEYGSPEMTSEDGNPPVNIQLPASGLTSPGLGETRMRPSGYRTGRMLGSGTYAIVREAMRIDNEKRFACKIINKQLMEGRESFVRNEIRILNRISSVHRNIVTLHDYFETPRNMYLVFDLCTGGDLFERICNKGSYSEVDAASLIRPILSAVQFIHAAGIVHRDLKPENLLFQTEDDDADIMIADFGLSRIMDDEKLTRLTEVCGTPGYMAPETILRQGHGKPVDVWAIGVITYFLLAGYMPFDRNTPEDEKAATIAGDFKFEPQEYWGNISGTAREFVSACLTLDPNRRPTAAEALEHKWLASASPHFVATLGGEPTDLLPQVKKAFDAKLTWRKAGHSIRAVRRMSLLGASSVHRLGKEAAELSDKVHQLQEESKQDSEVLEKVLVHNPASEGHA